MVVVVIVIQASTLVPQPLNYLVVEWRDREQGLSVMTIGVKSESLPDPMGCQVSLDALGRSSGTSTRNPGHRGDSH